MLNKEIEELKKLIELNNTKININKNKIHELNTISTENRLGRIAILSELVYLPICLGVVFLKLVPLQFMSLTILASSLTIGLIGNIIAEKSFKVKRRISRISSAKNEIEREEEIFKYELENEKLNNRNLAHILSIQTIENEASMINEITKSGKYTVSSKNTYDDRKNKELEEKISEKTKKLDEISTRKYISNIKIPDWMDIIMNSMMVGVSVGITMIIPMFANIANPVPTSPLIPLVSTLGAISIGMCTSIAVLNNKRKRQNKILSKYINNNEKIDVDNELINALNEVSKTHVDLLENKIKSEELDKNNEISTNDLTQNCTNNEYEPESVCTLARVFSNGEIEDKTLVKKK